MYSCVRSHAWTVLKGKSTLNNLPYFLNECRPVLAVGTPIGRPVLAVGSPVLAVGSPVTAALFSEIAVGSLGIPGGSLSTTVVTHVIFMSGVAVGSSGIIVGSPGGAAGPPGGAVGPFLHACIHILFMFLFFFLLQMGGQTPG